MERAIRGRRKMGFADGPVPKLEKQVGSPFGS